MQARIASLLASSLVVALLVACSGDDPAADCGPDTVERDGRCVAVGGDDAGGPDSTDDGVTCGEGTIRIDGECRPEGAVCGEGTVFEDGECVPAPTDAGSTETGTSDTGMADTGPADTDGADTASDGSIDTAPAPDTSCTNPETEWCDGRDNDCDGVVDNGEVCPDDSVQHTDSFGDGVYFLGTTAEGSCGASALQQFWPSLDTDYYEGFDCHANRFAFEPTSNRLYYHATFHGIQRNTTSGADSDPVVETPPCGENVGADFGFDGQGRLYYRCSDTLRRENGELLAQPINQLVATLDDGRTVVTRASNQASGDAFVVLDEQGQAIARLDPRDRFVGTLEALPGSASTAGDKAYVLFERTWGQDNREYVAFRLTTDNDWQRMRRLEVDQFGRVPLVISDGTVFVNERDPNTTFDNRIAAYHTDGQREVVWREANASEVKQHGGELLLVGPKGTPTP